MASEHIYKQFDSDLEAIRAKVLEMGTLVEEQTANAVKSLLNTDIKLAEAVMKRDVQINDFLNNLKKDSFVTLKDIYGLFNMAKSHFLLFTFLR